MEKRIIAKKLATWTVLLGVLLALIYSVDWRGTYSVIKKGDTTFIALAILITFLRFIIWSYKWKKTLSPLASISLSRLFPILMTGVFLNQITPGRDTGGEPIRAYYTSIYTGIKKREALATIVIDKSGNYVAISTFIGYSILFITLFMNVPPSVKVILEGIVLIFCLGAISAVYVKKNLALPGFPVRILRWIYFLGPLKKIRERFTSYALFEEYIMERISEFVITFRDLIKDRKNMRDNLLLSFLIWAMVFVKTYLIFLAFGQSVSIFMVAAVEAISILLGIISFLPGGVGATEITMIALFSSAGIGVEIATAVTIVSRGIYYAFSLGLGYLSFLYLKLLPVD
jgi:uncharacterized protein (TIRG00374 family)